MSTNTYQRIKKPSPFATPEHWRQFKTIDMHTGGEPLRVILSGFPESNGGSILEYRRHITEHFDHFRTALMFEPRGHADMYGCVLTPPDRPDSDFGILFMHNAGYSTMCGHAIIAISTLAAQRNWIDVNEGENQIKIDAPCGQITSWVAVSGGTVDQVRFQCVPSFVVGLDRTANVEGWGKVTYDLAYGGAFYAYVEMAKNHLEFDLSPSSYRSLIQAGMQIKQAVMEQDSEIQHPFESDLSFLYGTIFTGPSGTSGVDSRNVCIFADGEVDRSPTGSGVSGRMAIHHARNEIKRGETMAIESITGSVFTGSVHSEIKFGPHTAIIPEVAGTAHITGEHVFLIDPSDPMKHGFLLQ